LRFILADIVEPKLPKGVPAVALKLDLTSPAEIDKLYQTEFGIPDAIYCLHGIMSRGSEDNFDLGVKVNIDSIRYMLEAARHKQTGTPIKFVFTSSLAVYGGPLVCSR
jgi:nucleoside-diphosphate-sugar epimerase